MNLATLLTLPENKYVHQSITGHKEPQIHSSLAAFGGGKQAGLLHGASARGAHSPAAQSSQPLTLHCGWPEQWTSSTA